MLFGVATVLPDRYDALMALSTVAAIIGQAQTASSWELTPVIVAFVLSMVGLTVTLMRYQHVDSTKTREWTAAQFDKTNRQFEKTNRQFEKTNRETREWTAAQFEKTNRETARQFDLVRADIRGIGDSLNDARERLARIEGRLDATHPQPDGNDGEDDRDAA